MCLYGGPKVGYISPDMKPVIQVASIVGDNCVAGRYMGGELRRRAMAEVDVSGLVAVDFTGITMITQSAADEFVGRIMRHHEGYLAKIEFRNCTDEVREMIQWAADNADSVLNRQKAFA
jgi:hypothetical protein